MSSQSQSQYSISQDFPNGQKRQISKEDKIDEALESFNAELITRNNNAASDSGVHEVLIVLNNKDDRLKALQKRKFLKQVLLSGLGFLHNIDATQAGERFKGIKSEELMHMIAERYELLAPTVCNHCETIYNAMANDIGAQCFLCDKKMCPECCPDINSQISFKITLFPVC